MVVISSTNLVYLLLRIENQVSTMRNTKNTEHGEENVQVKAHAYVHR